MQVQRRHQRHTRADHGPRHLEKLAVGVVGNGRRHAAVGAEKNPVQRPGVGEAAAHLAHGGVEEPLLAGAAGFRARDQDRHRLPRDCGTVHFIHETGNFGRLNGVVLAQVGQDVFAGQVTQQPERRFLADGSEGVAFQVHAQEGDAFFCVVGVHGFSLPGARIPPVPGLPNAAAFG